MFVIILIVHVGIEGTMPDRLDKKILRWFGQVNDRVGH